MPKVVCHPCPDGQVIQAFPVQMEEACPIIGPVNAIASAGGLLAGVPAGLHGLGRIDITAIGKPIRRPAEDIPAN